MSRFHDDIGGRFGRGFGDENDAEGSSGRPLSARLSTALERVCGAWEVDAEGHELVAKMRRIARCLTRRKRLPPAPITGVLRDAEVAPHAHEILANWHVRPLPIDRLHERMTLEDRVPDELRPRLLASFLRRRNRLLTLRGEPIPRPPHDDPGHQEAPALNDEQAAAQWQAFLNRLDMRPHDKIGGM